MSIIVYSANIGNYDTHKEPLYKDSRVKYLLFTDARQNRASIWKPIVINRTQYSQDTVKSCRFIKINPHLVLPPHQYSIWVDHSFQIQFSEIFKVVLECLNGKEIACYKHGSINWGNNCLYKEAIDIIKSKLDNKETVISQMNKYKSEGFPENFGLYSTGFLVRKNTENVNRFNELWWSQVNKYSKRDQLSQCYSLWKTAMKINPIQIGHNIYDTPLLKKSRHIHKLKKK